MPAQARCTFPWECHGGVTGPARSLAIGLPGVSGYPIFLLVRPFYFFILILFACLVHHISGYKAVSSFAPCWAETTAQCPRVTRVTSPGSCTFACPSGPEPHVCSSSCPKKEAHPSRGNLHRCWGQAQACGEQTEVGGGSG